MLYLHDVFKLKLTASVLGLLFFSISTHTPSTFAQTTVNADVSVVATVAKTIKVVCPNNTNLGEYDLGETVPTQVLTCEVRHNKAPSNVSITASPANNLLRLTNGLDGYDIQFSNFSATSGVVSGAFDTGVVVNNIGDKRWNFFFTIVPESPVPGDISEGTYTGSQVLVFSLI